MVDKSEEQLRLSTREGTPPHRQRYRWIMLALGWISYFTFGVVSYSMAPLVMPVIEDLGISYSQMGIILGAWPLTYVAVATIGGAIIDRWGIRRSIFAGLVLIGLSEALRYFASGFGTMFFFVAMFGLGGPMLSIGCPKMISLWFEGKERGTAVGIYSTGPWIGGAATLSVMNSFIMPLTGYSWRIVFACFGLSAFAVALLWLLLSRDVRLLEAAKGAGLKQVFGGLFAVRNVKLVLVMGFISFSISHGFNGWLPGILEAGGLSPSLAGFAASIPIWCGVILVLVVPRLVPLHLRGRVLAVLAVLVAGSLMLSTLVSGTALVAVLVVYGLNYCFMPLLVLILMDLPEVGAKYMGLASGMFFCVSELGGFLGPLTVGAVKDLAGGFLAGTALLAGFSLVRLAIALMVKIEPALGKEAVLEN